MSDVTNYAKSPGDIRERAESIAKDYAFDEAILAGAICSALVMERERCANHLMLTVNAPAEALRLVYGELTAQEVRTIRAVLTQQAFSIRSSHE